MSNLIHVLLPFAAVLRPGVVQVTELDGKLTKYFVSSGSITVNDDSSVQVLAEEAHNVDDIDVSEARQLLSKYQSEYSSAGDETVSAMIKYRTIPASLIFSLHLSPLG